MIKILGFTGGPTSCYTASYSFISAITDKSTRTIRSENRYFYFSKFQIFFKNNVLHLQNAHFKYYKYFKTLQNEYIRINGVHCWHCFTLHCRSITEGVKFDGCLCCIRSVPHDLTVVYAVSGQMSHDLTAFYAVSAVSVTWFNSCLCCIRSDVTWFNSCLRCARSVSHDWTAFYAVSGQFHVI